MQLVMEGVFFNPLYTFGVQLVNVGEPSTQHNRIWIENRDQSSQTTAKVVQEAVKRFFAPLLASSRLCNYLIHGQALSVFVEKAIFDS